MLEKIKQNPNLTPNYFVSEKGQNLLIILIIILIGIISFGLGRLSEQKKIKSGIDIEYEM
ncbi:MAG: hypothetical protein AAB693_03000 [Patescibacteria group bacterium]